MLGINSRSAVEGNLKFIFLGDQRVAAVTASPTLGSEVLYYHADHLGGANVLTDATGFKKELIEYEPFGLESRHEKYGSSEEIAWYYFTGKKTDDESGLIYFGARYYNPTVGRFITPDTIVPYPGDPQSFNRYSYARNNPVNVIDPTGHKWSWKKFWHKASGFVATVVGVALGMVNPLLGMLAYSAIAASGQEGNYAKNFGVNFASSLAGYIVGGGVGGLTGSGFLGSSFGGAAAGAVTAAMLGGDVGRGALAGFAGGAINSLGGNIWPLGAAAVAGGAASVIQGGEFGEGAANGAYYNLAETTGGLLAPMPTLKEQNVQSGDAVYFKPGTADIIGTFVSFFEGGPFAHVGIVVDNKYMASADPVHGTTFQEWSNYQGRQAYVNRRFEGNQRVIAAARALAVSNRSYGFIGNQRVCSTTCASAFNQAGYRGWYGIGPNSQAVTMGYSQFRTTRMYGE